ATLDEGAALPPICASATCFPTTSRKIAASPYTSKATISSTPTSLQQFSQSHELPNLRPGQPRGGQVLSRLRRGSKQRTTLSEMRRPKPPRQQLLQRVRRPARSDSRNDPSHHAISQHGERGGG